MLPVWRFPCDARHVPIAEGKVRRTVLHRGRESATHPAQPRPRPRLRPAQLANVPEPAREPVTTIPPSSGTAPEFELENCQLATRQIIVFASRIQKFQQECAANKLQIQRAAPWKFQLRRNVDDLYLETHLGQTGTACCATPRGPTVTRPPFFRNRPSRRRQ